MVASKSDRFSELDKQVESKLVYWLKHPKQDIVSTSRKVVKTMSTSEEITVVTTVNQSESSPKIRTTETSASDNAGHGEKFSPTPSSSQPPDLRSSGKQRPAYLIKWSRFEDQLSNAFAELFCSEHFADVTLACDGGSTLKAHKIILAMSSPFFRRIFVDTPCKHPIVVLKEFSDTVMRNILQYLYMGKVVLNENEISSFMDAADFFGICGVIPDHYSCDIFATVIPEAEQKRQYDTEPQSDSDVKRSECSRTSENDESTETETRDSLIVSESPVIKYHGIKARWTRRYSNNSFPGAQNETSTIAKEHKRSASAGEVETVRAMEQTSSKGISKIRRLDEESLKQPFHEIENARREDSSEVFDEHSTREYEVEERRRNIIQRAHPQDYSSKATKNFEDSSDLSYDEWKNQGQAAPSFIPQSMSAMPSQKTIRGNPYILGTKDFTHPLQVSVEVPRHTPLYSTSPTSSGMVDPEKSLSGFPVYNSTHPLQSQMRNVLGPDPEAEFSQSSSSVSFPASHGNDERQSLRYHSSAASSPTTYRHQPEYPPRSHFSLLSTHHGWPFQESHHRHTHHIEDVRQENIARRFRADSFDRGLRYTTSASLCGAVTKPHSYSTPTDLTIPGSQQYTSAVGFIPQHRSSSSLSNLSTSTNTTRPKTKAIRSSQVPQSSRYTAAEVDQMVDAVANYPGNIVPCTLCQKFVKRERLRAHIHECHLLSGEKIICPHCGIALKSKGSFRVHIWRHKRGALPTRSTMSDFEGTRPPSPSHASGPASH